MDGLLARPLLVVIIVVVWMPCMTSPLISGSSRFMTLFLRSLLTMSLSNSGSSLPAPPGRWSVFEPELASFVEAFTSGMLRPMALVAGPRSGVPTVLPPCLLGTGDDRFSMPECIEFCLPLDTGGLPTLVGAGEDRAVVFESGNVLRIGDEANEGDIAIDVTVLFLFRPG